MASSTSTSNPCFRGSAPGIAAIAAMLLALVVVLLPMQLNAQPTPPIRVGAEGTVSLARGVRIVPDPQSHYSPADLPELRRVAHDLPLVSEIGRASCRERGQRAGAG